MPTLLATKPELVVHRALTKLGISFEFQSKMLGGYGEKGSTRADFSIPDLSLIISVIGEYWHYNRPDTLVRDKLQQIALETQGWKVVYIDANDALRNARYYVEQALMGISFSKFREV